MIQDERVLLRTMAMSNVDMQCHLFPDLGTLHCHTAVLVAMFIGRCGRALQSIPSSQIPCFTMDCIAIAVQLWHLEIILLHSDVTQGCDLYLRICICIVYLWIYSQMICNMDCIASAVQLWHLEIILLLSDVTQGRSARMTLTDSISANSVHTDW